MYRIVMAVVVVSLMSFSGTMAAEVKLESTRLAATNGGLCWLGVYGTIDKQTPDQIQRALTQNHCTGVVDFWLDSGGGDLNAAMECGRIIRRVKAKTTIVYEKNRCASACVLIFLAGVVRDGGGQIGLHRPFTAANSNSTVEAQQSFDRLNQKVKQYLAEMNISTRLLDIMNSVPPGKIKWLSMVSDRNELKELLVIGTDPVFEDESDSRLAKFLGISKKELYRRQMEADKICGNKESFSNSDGYLDHQQCQVNIIWKEALPHK